jgi:hypothetical protein
MRDKVLRRMLRKNRKHDARVAQKLEWERIGKFKAPAKASLGNKTRSVCGGGEIPNSR